MAPLSTLRSNVNADFGNTGQEWFDRLPEAQYLLASRYQLDNIVPFPNLTYNYVALAQAPQGAVVVKICFDRAQATREVAVLRAYELAGGAPKVIIYDEEYAALLLEQVTPGETMEQLFPHNDTAAVTATVRLMKTLHKAVLPAEKILPHMSEVLAPVLQKESSIIPVEIAEKAAQFPKYLLDTTSEEVLLHGDLHHGNMLKSLDGHYLSIDPQGFIGDPLAEIGGFMRNPYPSLAKQKNMSELLIARLDQFSVELGGCLSRITQWAFVVTVLSMYWAKNNSEALKNFKAVAVTLLSDRFSLLK